MSESTKTMNSSARVVSEETGIVVSNKMQKTIVVQLNRRKKHGKYGKFITRTKRVKAHDEANSAGIGDLVLLVETRPLSRDKRFALKKIVRRAVTA